MQSNDSILLQTAAEQLSSIEKATSGSFGSCKTELWRNIAHLYSAAVLQLSQKPPSCINISGFPDDLNIIRNLPKNFKPSAIIKEYLKILQFIVKVHENEKQDCMSDAALPIVKNLGRPLYERLKILLDEEFFPNPPKPPSELFKVQLNNVPYVLMLSYYKDFDNVFAGSLLDAMPDDGWDEKRQKLFPPLVRLLPCIGSNADNIPNVFYLSKLNPTIDETLNSISADQGLSLAALSMHRELVFDLKEIGKTKGGQTRFRIKEPKHWPDGWEKELEDQILLCSKNKIAIAALPELCGSPRVLDIVQKALLKCKNNFPILFIAGSWHTDTAIDSGNASFVNRLNVFSAVYPFDSIDPLITHDKFEPFSEGGYTEGNTHGTKGLTFLVTSLGVIAFGICKDLFTERASGMTAKAADQIHAALPFLTICPAMTGTNRDLIHSASTMFKHINCGLLVSNACGFVRTVLRDGICCRKIQNNTGSKKTGDVRSFISAPNSLYKMTCFENDKSMISSEHGIYIARSSCPGEGSLTPGQSYKNFVSVCLNRT